MKSTTHPFYFTDLLWDAWCIASIVGIWPRFIEPGLLETNRLNLRLPSLPSALKGLKIVQFSDLHLHRGMSDRFLNKLSGRIMSLNPDLIVFCGDFLCHAKTDNPERLKRFLNSLHAPHGCYAVLGNHDYEESVALNAKGEYDTAVAETSMIQKGFARLFTTPLLAKKTTPSALEIPPNGPLIELLKQTPFTLLHNANEVVAIKNAGLNICGLGEYTVGRTIPSEAFAKYDPRYPGIILLHNPDGIRLLEKCPGSLILCGHTHGGQVYLPWMWKRFTLLENMEYVRGVKHFKDKTIYISRGVGGVMTFRWRARPEILCITLGESA